MRATFFRKKINRLRAEAAGDCAESTEPEAVQDIPAKPKRKRARKKASKARKRA